MLSFNPFSALTSKIFGGVAIAALAFAAVQTVRIEGFPFIKGFKQELAEKDRTIAQMESASAANLAAQQAQVKQTEAAFVKQAEITNAKQEALEADYRRRLAAYAGRMRLESGCVSPTSTSGEGPVAPVDHGPGEGAGLVAIRQDDLETLVENTARLQAVHQWGERLVADGLAAKPVTAADLPDPAF
jgi:multidrug efflux pump subunit AcrA (membrane-fusion protein)